MSRHSADGSTPAGVLGAATMRPHIDRASACSKLIEILARQLVNDTIRERNESLPVRPIQH
ncbi:hypothetical protein D3C87_2035530 [compost metagenome]